jgi:hypothetical protein
MSSAAKRRPSKKVSAFAALGKQTIAVIDQAAAQCDRLGRAGRPGGV